ncbi:MAG: methyltransferase, partial [Candidatus Parvarchaeota archaeon]|nr:methyltransferase [Candidatus Parvarchaeota archaeon]
MAQLKDTIIKLVDDYKIKSSNENGQNFLIDEEVLREEIEKCELKSSDIVLDIGAGFGSIENLVSKKCKIIAIEKEIKCYSYLIDKYEIDQNVQIINSDALDMIYPKFNKILSNPPYNISDRIIEKLSF